MAAPFPWDPRPLGPLDYYAAAHFFGCAIPAALCVLAGTRLLSAAGVAAGAAWVALTITSLGQLLDGTVQGVRWELARQVAQVAALKFALWRGLLPLERLPQAAAWAAGAVMSASLLVLVAQLVMLAPAPPKAAAAKAKRA